MESIGLSIVDDPYLPENNSRFSADLSSFPQIECGHIFGNFVSHPGTYTLRNSC